MAFKIPKPRYDAAVVAAIEDYLDQEEQTEIAGHYPAHFCEDDGLITLTTIGARAARRRANYVRPMFQAIPLGASSTIAVRDTDPCPDCDNWAYTSRCAQHAERGLDRQGRFQEIRPYIPPTHDYHPRFSLTIDGTYNDNGLARQIEGQWNGS